METVINIHRFEGEGDVLCFLTGQQEIATAQALINEAFSALKQFSLRLLLLLLL